MGLELRPARWSHVAPSSVEDPKYKTSDDPDVPRSAEECINYIGQSKHADYYDSVKYCNFDDIA